ncbi:MAG: 6-bladed beta-propeller [Geobacteraceae bacterium]|nr:6-bladed beta-propeller [Geobacteraceae bacterium]
MADVVITCPYCQFSKSAPQLRLPQHDVAVTCPKCRQRFQLAAVIRIEPVAPAAPAVDQPSPAKRTAAASQPRSKAILLLFVLLIVLLVWVRLWADGKKQSVPFPNFLAASANGVAVSWGTDIYLLDHAGKMLEKHPLPPELTLTQLKFVGDELWLGDHTTKAIRRLRDGKLETVVDGAGRFRGAFKFAADLQTGQIFVTDSSNHQVHVFGTDGRHLSTFGTQGKGAGQLMFPNSIAFDANGDLLIANTNANRLDIFARDGRFLRTFAHVAPIGAYMFPTLFAQGNDRIVLFQTVDLRHAKALVYDGGGRLVGELPVPEPLTAAGDVAVCEGKILLTDNATRRVYRFAADTLAAEGTFSPELDAYRAVAAGVEAQYGRISTWSLVMLLLACAPVVYLYLRMRRQEQRQVQAVASLTGIVPAAAIWGAETNRQKLVLAVAVLVPIQLIGLYATTALRKQPLAALLALAAMWGLLVIFLRLFMSSGYGNSARKANVEKMAAAAGVKLPEILLPGETVQGAAAFQRTAYLKHAALLLLTSRRLLLADFSSMRPIAWHQLGYGDIAGSSLEPVKMPLNNSSFVRMMRAELFALTLALQPAASDKPLQLVGYDLTVLKQIRQHIKERRQAAESLGHAQLCGTCYRPMKSDGCPACRKEPARGWKPQYLSLLYPGFGQFYNREIGKGTVLAAFFTIDVLFLTRPFITLVNRSAEVTPIDAGYIAKMAIMTLALYVISYIDAAHVGRKGRYKA